MKKYILAIAAVLATAVSAFAIDYSYTLVLNRTDGNKNNFQFETTPVATINGEELTIVENLTQLTVVVPISEIVNFTFEKEEIGQGIENIKVDNGGVTFRLSQDTLEVAGLSEGVDIQIFDINGQLRAKAVSDVDGTATIAMTGWDKGVYVVYAGTNKFKFIR